MADNNEVSVQQSQPPTLVDALNAIIDSIAHEENEVANLIIADAKKIHAAINIELGNHDLGGINDVLTSVERLLRSVVKKNIVLETKLQDALNAATSLGISPDELNDTLLNVLFSIAAEESALGDVIGGLAGAIIKVSNVADNFDDLIAVNNAAERVLRTIIKKEIVLETKMQDVLDFIVTSPTPPPPPPGTVCHCEASFIVPNPRPIIEDGTIAGTGRLSRAGAPEGRVRVCRTCDPALSELFEFRFTPNGGGSTTTFVASSYTPNPVDGALGDCCTEADGTTIRFTLTGTGTFNGIPNTPFTLILEDRQPPAQGTATLIVGGHTFVADNLPPGNINITACPGFSPGPCM